MSIKVRIAESRKCNGDYSMFLSFPYDSHIVEVVKGFSSRYWSAEWKLWEVPVNKLPELLSKLPEQEFQIEGLDKIKEKESVNIPVNFKFKTVPFQHQIEGVQYGLEHKKWLLGDEQGLGKTKQVIDLAITKKIQNGYKHCLIICGVNGLKWNWASEIKKHSDESSWILGQRERNHRLKIGSNTDKLADLTHISDIHDYFIITNVESLRNAEITAELSRLCRDGIINMIAADEVHKMKNPSSQQGKGFLKLSADTMIAMTGTPLMNTPLDLYIILKWLGYEKHSFYAFRNHYAEFGGFEGREIVGYRNLNELQESLNGLMLRRLKQDVLDLPAKLRVEEFVEMTPKQKQIYDEVTAEIKMNIDQIKMANNPLAELIRMRQATGYTGILSSTVQESAKLDRMEELVEEAVQNGKKVVIFSNWAQMTEAIHNRMKSEYHAMQITGAVSEHIRNIAVNEFQNGKCKVLIGTIGAMGTGLTLTAGTVEIFMDEPWNRANKEQAEDRCHRVGTTGNVTIYTIMCKDTIDEKIHNLVEKKGALADMLVDGKVKGNSAELLDYLLN